TVRVKKSFAPWLTDTLKIVLRQRDSAYAAFKRDRTEENWLIYKKMRNFAQASMRREKKAFLEQLSRDDTKNFRTFIRPGSD
ncbi:hypothetical protein HHI36_012940, partial [Cryptolaemus montrouzieri]